MFKKLSKKKESEKKDNTLEFKDGSIVDFDLLWLQRELEFQHQHEKFQIRTNESHSLKFGELINSLFDIRKQELSVLTINDGILTTIEGEDNIWNYEFLAHYKRNEKGEYNYYREGCSKLPNQIVLTLAYRTRNRNETDKDKSKNKKDAILIVHLQYPEGLREYVIYVQTTFLLPAELQKGYSGGKRQPQCLSLLIGIDYRPNEETTQEYLTVFNSAKEKLSSNRIVEMSLQEREILEVLFVPDVAKEFYLGKRAMTENKYWDAINYFQKGFNVLQQNWWEGKLTDEELTTLIECSYLIGFCYYDLGLFDKSYKYLEFSAANSDKYQYQCEYINCLIALRDVRSIIYIEKLFETMESKNADERTQEDFDFFLFLLRRKAYCMIEIKEYEHAKEILKEILKYDPENDFAKSEIDFINRKRRN